MPKRPVQNASHASRSMLMGLLIWLGALLCSVNASAEDAAPTLMLVNSVRFEGLESRGPDELIDRLATQIGQPYNPLLVREDVADLSRIMRQVFVRNEPSETDGVDVVFIVEEFPRLRQLHIIGNSRIATERIQSLAGVKPGDIINANTIRSMRNALQTEYRKFGLPAAKIDVNLAAATPAALPAGSILPQTGGNETDLQVIIDEGESILIDDLIIEGNESFNTFLLKVKLETKGSWWFLKNFYDDDALENDLATLRRFYASHGFFDATVERSEFRERREGDKLVITPVILITEGRKYKLAGVQVRGARQIAPEEIRQAFDDLLYKDFNGKTFGKALTRVQNLYLDHGYLTSEIKTVYDHDEVEHGLGVMIEITEDQRIYANDIKIRRPTYDVNENPSWFRALYDRIAPPISDEAILREVMLKPGEIYSRVKERQTLRRLERLGIFSEVEITNQPTENSRMHDVLISVEESSSGGFFGGVGFGDISGAFVFVSFKEQNLFGDARDFGIRAQIGTRASNFSLHYTNRHFRDTDDIFSMSLYWRNFLRPGWRERVAGGQVEIGRPLYNDWERFFRVRIEHVRLNERSGVDPDEDLDVSYPVLTGRLRFVQDTRYPIDQPTEGRKIAGAVEAGWADGPLIKFTADGAFNYALTDKVTYHVEPKFGLMPYNSDTVGITERLFLGGTDDLRGFKYRGAGRRDKDDDDVSIGGAAKILVRNEIHFPIYDPVYGVFFVDAGMLGKNPFSYEVPRLSTGLGFRLKLARTAVGIDFALPILSKSGDQTQFFHFSFSGHL